MAEKSSTADRELIISRVLNAPVDLVWEVWTDPEHLKNWWGPNGFTNTIHLMDLRPGGEWNLTMHGPDGKDYKNKSVYKVVDKNKKIVFDHFNPNFTATIDFEAQGEKTAIKWHMLFASKEEFIAVVKAHGADEGLKQNVDKLNHYLQTQGNIRKQLKTTSMARVCSYLNFPGNTEEAFNFYKTVFGTEFSGGGLQRFADVPGPEGMPPLSEADKKLILHVELPITGGHILMATDAPESMGFKLQTGNNMHIMVEPETKEETTRIFEALAAGGATTMPLQDMFFGAYFGSCTDKYGINWMLNFTYSK